MFLHLKLITIPVFAIGFGFRILNVVLHGGKEYFIGNSGCTGAGNGHGNCMETATIKLVEIKKEWFENLPATVVKFNQNVRQYNLLGYFIEALKTADVIFVDIFVEGGAKRDVASNAGNPFVDATFNLRKIG